MEHKDEIEALRLQLDELKEQVERLSEKQNSQYTDLMLQLKKIEDHFASADITIIDEDAMYEEAKELIIEHQTASTSLLQRTLNIGYSRAARLMDLLEENEVVGPMEGAKPRKILIQPEGVEE